VLYYLLLFTTTLRFVDIIYLLAGKTTDLPLPVILVTTAMVLYGIVLIVRKFVGTILLKHLQTFYLVQTAMIVFNIAYIALMSPLDISAVEFLVVGSFLDLIVNACILFACNRQMHRRYTPAATFLTHL